jgi:sugar phosphate permease
MHAPHAMRSFRTTHVFVGALTVVGLLAAFVGSGINAASLLMSWPLLKACQTFLYPCAVKVICRWFPSHHWSVMIAAGSTIMTVGSTLSNLFLGVLLTIGLSWRALFYTAACLTLAAAALNAALLRNSPACVGLVRPPCTDIKTGKAKAKVAHHMDAMTMRGVVEFCARSPRFWAMAGMTVTLHTLNEVQSYLTLFLTGEKALAHGTAASVACVWHIGLASSSMAFGSVFDHLRAGHKYATWIA